MPHFSLKFVDQKKKRRWLNKREQIKISRFIKKMLTKLNIKTLKDPRKAQGKRWKLESLINGLLLGLASGQKSLKDVENLTDNLPRAAQKLLQIKRRISDTTLRDFLVKVDKKEFKTLLHRSVHQLRRNRLWALNSQLVWWQWTVKQQHCASKMKKSRKTEATLM